MAVARLRAMLVHCLCRTAGGAGSRLCKRRTLTRFSQRLIDLTLFLNCIWGLGFGLVSCGRVCWRGRGGSAKAKPVPLFLVCCSLSTFYLTLLLHQKSQNTYEMWGCGVGLGVVLVPLPDPDNTHATRTHASPLSLSTRSLFPVASQLPAPQHPLHHRSPPQLAGLLLQMWWASVGKGGLMRTCSHRESFV